MREEIIKKFYSMYPEDKYEIVEIDTKKRHLTVKHVCCSTEYTHPFNIFFQRFRHCPKCTPSPKIDTDIFKSRVRELVGDEYTVLSEYKTNKIKILMRHEKCGNEYMVQPNKFLDGRRCPKCSHRSTKKTQEEFQNEVKELVGDEYTVLGDYINTETKILFRHEKCGNEYETTPLTFLRGRRCPKCSHRSTKKTQEEFQNEVKELVGDEYTVVSDYKGNRSLISLCHKDCGKTFKVMPNNFLKSNVRCPHCKDYSSSKGENEVFDFIKSIYSGDIEKHKKVNKREIDIFLPDLNIGFEFDGLYWHSDEKVGEKYQLQKTDFFKEKGIRIVHIFEDEWEQKKSIVQTKIAHIINQNTEKRHYARKCKINEIDKDLASDFLNKYHIQGNSSSLYKVGLFSETDELVAVMTFSKSRVCTGRHKNKRDELELLRYATKYPVVGGFSKLLKWSISKYSIKKIVTYADLRWTDENNNVYQKNGFTLIHKSEPSYFYFKNTKRFHRFTFAKQKLKDKFPDIFEETLTEREIMKKAGYKRIYDCGNLVYQLDVK